MAQRVRVFNRICTTLAPSPANEVWVARMFIQVQPPGTAAAAIAAACAGTLAAMEQQKQPDPDNTTEQKEGIKYDAQIEFSDPEGGD